MHRLQRHSKSTLWGNPILTLASLHNNFPDWGVRSPADVSGFLPLGSFGLVLPKSIEYRNLSLSFSESPKSYFFNFIGSDGEAMPGEVGSGAYGDLIAEEGPLIKILLDEADVVLGGGLGGLW